MSNLLDAIDRQIGEVRTESLDLSFGEIVNLHKANELVIQPEYQRLFRWSQEQRSRLVESILLELPIPPIFLIENDNGVLELIDGLQRTSSVIQFIEASQINLDPLVLDGCDLINELNTKKFLDLPMTLRMRIKRSAVRAIIIKRQSKPFLKYEMFKRLNTGGALLSPQEIRNCSSRMVGDIGVDFYSFLQQCASKPFFKRSIIRLPEEDFEKRQDEELVLRFFALINGIDLFKGSVRDWLDDYMEKVLKGDMPFDYKNNEEIFDELFSFIDKCFSNGAFSRYSTSRDPVGRLAPAYFEAVAVGVYEAIQSNITVALQKTKDINEVIITTVLSEPFKAVTGPGANTQTKLRERILLIREAVTGVL
ncbi:DUF262 domain-containing protein [Aeromonas caviae]|uniref:DUF262 domain-containing protein n=2 Tax=Aeromonas TaxID=642 RepID=UPI0038D0F4A8